jgi:hypothetical protein
MSVVDGSISIDKALAYGFGFLFVVVMLIFAVAVPSPSEFTLFVFRVVLALAAAGIGAVLPGLLEIVLPGIRAGGALALAAMVYFLNPPGLIHDSLQQKAVSYLNDALAMVNRGDMISAQEDIEKAKMLKPEPVEILFFLELSKSDCTISRRLKDIFVRLS